MFWCQNEKGGIYKIMNLTDLIKTMCESKWICQLKWFRWGQNKSVTYY